jgi:integrase
MVFMPPKTSAGRRTIQLGEEILQSLRSHYAQQQIAKAVAGERWVDLDLVFPSRTGMARCSELLLQEFKTLLGNAGVKQVRFHDLRHTFASIALNNGIPPLIVSKVLGHSKPSTTLDIYSHLIPVYQEEVALLMDQLVTPIQVRVGEKADTEPQSDPTQDNSNCTSIAREPKSSH